MNPLDKPVSRRVALTGLGAVSAAVILAGEATAASAPPRVAKWSGSRSANGWPINAGTSRYPIEGTDLSINLADGATATVLLHAVRRINYEFDTLRADDLVGLATSRAVESPERSNLLSGTAIHFRPGSFPRGTNDLFADERIVFEDIVAEAGGILAWGGHLDVPDQGLFYIAQGPASGSTGQLAGLYDAEDRMDTRGGVGTLDAHDPGRRRAAKRFRRQQQ